MSNGLAYEYNPDCACAWCQNQGTNPHPGDPATLGYDEPHMPPASMTFAPRPARRPPLKQVA